MPGLKDRMTQEDPVFGPIAGANPGMTLIDRAQQGGDQIMQLIQMLQSLFSGAQPAQATPQFGGAISPFFQGPPTGTFDPSIGMGDVMTAEGPGGITGIDPRTGRRTMKHPLGGFLPK